MEIDSPLEQRRLADSGIACSAIGAGTGGSRLSDLAQAWTVDSLSDQQSVFQRMLATGGNVFELGCAATSPGRVAERYEALQRAATSQPSIGMTVIIRCSLRALAPSPVELEYWLRVQSPEGLLKEISPHLERCSGLMADWGAQREFRPQIFWIWDDVDFRQSASRGTREKIFQLLHEFASRCPITGSRQGVGGYRWQALAELASQCDPSLVLLHASFGLLGPSLEDSLLPICRRRGIAVVGSLPLYGGLLHDQPAVPPDHPATLADRKSVEAARILCEEFGMTLERYAYHVAIHNAADTVLFQIPTPEHLQRVEDAALLEWNARSEAMVSRHLGKVRRQQWWETD